MQTYHFENNVFEKCERGWKNVVYNRRRFRMHANRLENIKASFYKCNGFRKSQKEDEKSFFY